MSAYATKPSTAFITGTELKRTPASKTSRAIRQFINTHDFSIMVENGSNLKCAVTEKNIPS